MPSSCSLQQPMTISIPSNWRITRRKLRLTVSIYKLLNCKRDGDSVTSLVKRDETMSADMMQHRKLTIVRRPGFLENCNEGLSRQGGSN